MNYYNVFHHIAQMLPRDCIIVSEGANTMDIGRTMLHNHLPRHRQGTLAPTEVKGDMRLTFVGLCPCLVIALNAVLSCSVVARECHDPLWSSRGCVAL